MSTPFLGEIRMFAFGFRGAPNGWQACDGSLLSISANTALFALLGTTYGGDGQVTFGVPDLRGRVPIHQGQGPGLSSYVMGQQGGSEAVSLTANQMPAHTHTLSASSGAATSPSPTGAVLAADSADPVFATANPTVNMSSTAVGVTGGSQPHENCMPTLTVQFCIATDGIFPQRP